MILGGVLGWASSYLVNDSVMGGSASGTLAAVGTALHWRAKLVPEGGGFATCRSPIPAAARGALEGATSISFEASGTPNAIFELRVHVFQSHSVRQEVAYSATFASAPDGTSRVFFVPLTDFTPRWRGQTVAAPPLRARDIESIGFMVTKAHGQRGDFNLVVPWIGVD